MDQNRTSSIPAVDPSGPTQIERLARALCFAEGEDPDFMLGENYPAWKGNVSAVRAILIELREPKDDALLAALTDVDWYLGVDYDDDKYEYSASPGRCLWDIISYILAEWDTTVPTSLNPEPVPPQGD